MVKLNENLKKENLRRKSFLSKYGGILPHNFIPGLKSTLAEVQMNLSYGNLPVIDNIHNDDELIQEFDSIKIKDSWLSNAGFVSNINNHEKLTNFGVEVTNIGGQKTKLETDVGLTNDINLKHKNSCTENLVKTN